MKKERLAIRSLSCGLVVSMFLLPLVVGRILYASQQNRGQGVRIKVGNGQEINLYDESHALVVGVGDYTNGWRKLDGVKKDVPAVAALLQQLGFQVETLMNPTGDALDKALRTFINKRGLKERNRLLIYFAGHGYTETLPDGRDRGYLVPADAALPERDLQNFNLRAISMDQMDTFARGIHAKHALFVFDSCFSGSIFESRGGNESRTPPAIESKTASPVRQFITSGTKAQAVPDESVFRAYFVRAFEQREGDLNGDGFVTGEELGIYLAGRVASDSRDTQTPRFGKIKDVNLNLGDFVFALPKPKPKPTPTPTPIIKLAPIPKQSLIDAINEENIAVIGELVDQGVDINALDQYGSTPLVAAVNKCSFTIVKMLLAKGANLEARTSSGATALIAIMSREHCSNLDRIAQALLDAGANVNAKDNYGQTVLIHAVTGSQAINVYKPINPKLVETLLAKGANVNARDIGFKKNGF